MWINKFIRIKTSKPSEKYDQTKVTKEKSYKFFETFKRFQIILMYGDRTHSEEMK